MSNVTALFQPLKLGPLTLKNRIFMSALTRSRSVPTNVPNAINGVLVTQQGTEWQNAPGIWNKEQVDAWKKVTDAVHDAGSVIFAQLWHLGRVSHPNAPEQIAAGVPVYAPSALAARGGKFRFLEGEPGYVTPTAIDDPWKLVALFKQAAINAKEAGFDGVEIHGANGYLVHQFLDSTSNQRTDQWGGSVENRSRFGLEVLKAAIDVWGADRVAIKLNPAAGYNDVGMPLEETIETFKYFIEEADKLGIAYFTLVRYADILNPEYDGEFLSKRGTIHDIIATYGPFVKKALVFSNAGFTPVEAAEHIESGKVAGVFFGFLWVTHPDVALRVKHGKPLDNAPDFQHLYGAGGDLESQRMGYTDYPAASYD
ncbi:flavoprotein NADH-dependent oxidoreductase [Mucidula mucida]|nr:flavoprotein NADH-dependent oxidoreductase [Mucidula mucida]